MSRVGKLPVEVPNGVKVEIQKNLVTVKGAKGEMKTGFTSLVTITQEGNQIWVKPANDSQDARAQWGTMRNVMLSLVKGVSDGFTKRLEIEGVGYRAAADKQFLSLSLGFSHEIKFAIPAGITIVCEKPTLVVVSGFDKQKVGEVAAQIRKLRPPEPYKGKGVRYEGEYIRRKEGKKK